MATEQAPSNIKEFCDKNCLFSSLKMIQRKYNKHWLSIRQCGYEEQHFPQDALERQYQYEISAKRRFFITSLAHAFLTDRIENLRALESTPNICRHVQHITCETLFHSTFVSPRPADAFEQFGTYIIHEEVKRISVFFLFNESSNQEISGKLIA